MKLARIEPWDDLNTLHERMNKIFKFPAVKSYFDDVEPLAHGKWAPAVDVSENESEYIVKADLPGISKEDMTVDISDNVITIKGERKHEEKVEEDKYVLVERSYGTFTRSFSLPQNVDAEGIKANYADGVLELKLPKKEESKPKQIKVNVN